MRFFVVLVLTLLLLIAGFLYWSYQKVRSVPVEQLKALQEHRVNHQGETVGSAVGSLERIKRRVQKGQSMVIQDADAESLIREWIHRQYPEYGKALESLKINIQPNAVVLEALVDFRQISSANIPAEVRQGLKLYKSLLGNEALKNVYVKINAVPVFTHGEIQLASGSYVQIGGMKIGVGQLPINLRRGQWLGENGKNIFSSYRRLELQKGRLIFHKD